MDFLFAPLPASNFQMTDEQLVLWQRNAVFECECDNFVNGRIEAVRRRSLIRPPSVERSAIDAAVQRHGLRTREHDVPFGAAPANTSAHVSALMRRVHPRDNDSTAAYAPLVRRMRLVSANAERESDNFLDNFYQEACSAAIRERGLWLQRHP